MRVRIVFYWVSLAKQQVDRKRRITGIKTDRDDIASTHIDRSYGKQCGLTLRRHQINHSSESNHVSNRGVTRRQQQGIHPHYTRRGFGRITPIVDGLSMPGVTDKTSVCVAPAGISKVVFASPITALVAASVRKKSNCPRGPMLGDTRQPVASVSLALIMTAKNVAGVPTCTDRLAGNTAETTELSFGMALGSKDT